jgi:hypothetical protein
MVSGTPVMMDMSSDGEEFAAAVVINSSGFAPFYIDFNFSVVLSGRSNKLTFDVLTNAIMPSLEASSARM